MFQAQAASLAVIHRSGSEIPGVIRDLWRLAATALTRRQPNHLAASGPPCGLAEELVTESHSG